MLTIKRLEKEATFSNLSRFSAEEQTSLGWQTLTAIKFAHSLP